MFLGAFLLVYFPCTFFPSVFGRRAIRSGYLQLFVPMLKETKEMSDDLCMYMQLRPSRTVEPQGAHYARQHASVVVALASHEAR